MKAAFAEGDSATYEVDYGGARWPWLDRDEARSLRREMPQSALRRGKDEFGEKYVPGCRRELARKLEKYLRTACPRQAGVRTHVAKVGPAPAFAPN